MKFDTRLLQASGTLRGYLVVTVGLSLLAGALTIAQAYVLSRIIDAVFLGGQGLAAVQGGVLSLAAVTGGRAVLAWGSDVAAGRAAGRAKRTLRDRLVAHLLALGPQWTRGERSGELSTAVTEGIESLDAYFSQYLPQLFLVLLVPLLIMASVFSVDLLSGVVLLVTAPLLPIFMILVGKLAEAQTARQWRVLSQLSAHFLDVLQGLTTLKLFGRSGLQRATIRRISERYRDATMGVLRVAFLSALVLEIGATISTAIIAVEIGLRLLYGQIAFAPALFVLLLAPEFYMPFRALGARFHAAMGGGVAAGRLFAILDLPVPAPAPAPVLPDLATVPIRFDAVSYAYAPRPGAPVAAPPPALDALTFTLAPGERMALVGPSGAGKSTVAGLLLRFLEPTAGQVWVGAQPLAAIPAAAWRTQVAWVPQHPYLFHGTVAENIRLGRPQATWAEVARAAEVAHAAAFIAALPQGYDTMIGERGARLSAGQAQRIGLARAFLKNAPLLILDEATAHLDPEHESLIMEAMARLMEGRSVLLIAHRLGTAARADRVLVLDGGRLVEAGDHHSLLTGAGMYRRLVAAYGGEA